MAKTIAGGGVILTEPDEIRAFQDLTRLKALRLETIGLRRRGRSVLSICREVYGLRSRTGRAAVTELEAQFRARGILRDIDD